MAKTNFKKVGMVLAVVVIFGVIMHFTKVNALNTEVKAVNSHQDKDTVIQNYSNYILLSSSYLDYSIDVLNGSQQEISTFAKTASIFFDNTNLLKSDQVVVSEYNKTYGQKSGELIKSINANLAQYQNDLYDTLQRTNIKQLNENSLIQNNVALSSDLLQSSPNLYDIERVYKTTEKNFGKNKIYDYLNKLNKEILMMDSKIGDKQ